MCGQLLLQCILIGIVQSPHTCMHKVQQQQQTLLLNSRVASLLTRKTDSLAYIHTCISAQWCVIAVLTPISLATAVASSCEYMCCHCSRGCTGRTYVYMCSYAFLRTVVMCSTAISKASRRLLLPFFFLFDS